MDELFSKAIDALDSSLNEFPSSSADASAAAAAVGGTSAAAASATASLLQDMEAFQDATLPPSAIDAAKRVLAAWEEIDMEGKKSGWDALGLTISQFQETSSKNRRSLAEQTKAFKSSGGEKKDFAPLLKAYQAEIDSITKRAKHAESAYLGARVNMLEQRLSAATAAAAASPRLRPASATPAAAAVAAAAGESLPGEENTASGEESGAKSPALSSASASDAVAVSVLEEPEEAKERLVSRLHMQLQQMQETLQREREEWEGALQQAQQQVAEREAQVQQAQAELQGRASPAQVEELRQQIRVLQVGRGGGMGEGGKWGWIGLGEGPQVEELRQQVRVLQVGGEGIGGGRDGREGVGQRGRVGSIALPHLSLLHLSSLLSSVPVDFFAPSLL
ncbi:unnamed protein product [Closterium sp. NIES-54]